MDQGSKLKTGCHWLNHVIDRALRDYAKHKAEDYSVAGSPVQTIVFKRSDSERFATRYLLWWQHLIVSSDGERGIYTFPDVLTIGSLPESLRDVYDFARLREPQIDEWYGEKARSEFLSMPPSHREQFHGVDFDLESEWNSVAGAYDIQYMDAGLDVDSRVIYSFVGLVLAIEQIHRRIARVARLFDVAAARRANDDR